MRLTTGVLILNAILLTSARPKEAADDLLAVAVVFRHGDRTIISTYPNDPYKNRSNWPVGFGQLTNAGKQRHYELGKWFRQRYDGFLPEAYSEEDIRVQSTDVDRTLMSAASNLAALYSPKGDQVWNEEILWQPIPIHTIPESEDNSLQMSKNCPKYNKLKEEFLNGEYVTNLLKENQDLLDYCTKNSGKEIKTLSDVSDLNDVFVVEKNYFNYTLPEWTDSVYPDRLTPLAGISFALSTYTKDLARLKTGVFWNNLVTNFQKVISGESGVQKFLMFSSHDTIVANLLQSLEAYDFVQPPYASTVILELRGDSQKSYVNIFYKKFDTVNEITLKDCEFDCDFDEFVAILKPITVSDEDWNKECNE